MEQISSSRSFSRHPESTKCRGYLYVGMPEKSLALHDEVRRQIQSDTNLWLDWKLDLHSRPRPSGPARGRWLHLRRRRLLPGCP